MWQQGIWADGFQALGEMPAPVYRDELITVYKNDCRDVLPWLTPEPGTHFITDPPYEEEAHTKGRRTQGKKDWKTNTGRTVTESPLHFASISEDVREYTVAESLRLADRWAILFCQAEAVAAYKKLYGKAYRRPMVWVKPDGMPNLGGDRPGMGYESMVAAFGGTNDEFESMIASWVGTGRSKWNGGGSVGVFTVNKAMPGGGAPFHPTQKPEQLMRRLLEMFTDPGDLVIDSFGGALTTAKACRDMGRRCIIIERDDENKGYVEYGIERMTRMQPLFMM